MFTNEIPLDDALSQAREMLLSRQNPEGYWWYPLEANETIGAGTILLMRYIGVVDPAIEKGLANRILSEQKEDGSWGIYYGAPGDLSATVECYLALKISGRPANDPVLQKARQFILSAGGVERVRVFTRIHLALFGLVPWESCPLMPVWFALLPSWFPVNIYSFSSWARASIVPLLIVLDQKRSRPIPGLSIDEIFANPPDLSGSCLGFRPAVLTRSARPGARPSPPALTSKKRSLDFCERWVRDHIARTEDIFPAMAYAIYALSALGHPNTDPTIQKAWSGLKRFQQTSGDQNHQQCCISPVWDTPWAGMALLEAGEPADSPPLLRAGRWLISKQILDFYGDWGLKNKKGRPGGWAFEFQNDYFPDVDDTIEVLFFLNRVGLPPSEKEEAIRRGLDWLLSMQCRNGGWAAFDKDNTQGWVNRIPFSDHGACLDPPTPDVTGRMLELLSEGPERMSSLVVAKAITFLKKTQEPWGGWWGRWGVNYIYGTWAVLQGLAAIGEDLRQPYIRRAVSWLKSVQNPDGGWGESCDSYRQKKFVSLKESVPSQTAWALMGLIAAGGAGPTGEVESGVVENGISWLVEKQTADGTWEEAHFTGTGFPGHFYIRYHGYRDYFPTLALGRYQRILEHP